MSAAIIWFCRLVGPALLVTLLAEPFVGSPVDRYFPFVAGPLYLVAWVGAFLVFMDGRGAHRKFTLPFAFIALAILSLLVTTLAPVPPPVRLYLGETARVAHALAAIAFTAIGWTARPR
jgi:hypothetical protein